MPLRAIGREICGQGRPVAELGLEPGEQSGRLARQLRAGEPLGLLADRRLLGQAPHVGGLVGGKAEAAHECRRQEHRERCAQPGSVLSRPPT
ncbi:MAG: hypothetical protein U1E17_05110 [Geminicoccaceae bacterium]